jgi:ribosomal-protein-alanine N-acetyltransferase
MGRKTAHSLEEFVVPVEFVELPPVCLRALLAGNLAEAGAELGVELPAFFLTERARWTWRYRLDQLTADPGIERWLTRAAVLVPDAVVVGYGGFHGPPDGAGMVELGYTVLPEHRRQGHARAMLGTLVGEAGLDPAVATVRVTISPDNDASLATIAGFGFVQVGEQWDDRDGLELIFEMPAPHPARRAPGRPA